MKLLIVIRAYFLTFQHFQLLIVFFFYQYQNTEIFLLSPYNPFMCTVMCTKTQPVDHWIIYQCTTLSTHLAHVLRTHNGKWLELYILCPLASWTERKNWCYILLFSLVFSVCVCVWQKQCRLSLPFHKDWDLCSADQSKVKLQDANSFQPKKTSYN